ncbi:Stk1 family PASTA domain-containing Ser/Thr kinase [Actinotalea sp. M2MS4P-6]|uniref:Stk1 family PASTA domain-containing Ser/Thr kinase n=1 Tax=Actinotalea sp. M2MS4P-6 TaxID=2983762 RepID=UPI0021E41064|nr:Stk1 family PASTA domain-containing Ser/Thr kinase [Actinotalea sp. M2MS4P-6]MCV2392824.1 Stk1 family PASTA domain-containing Ser/Thr kinase [Actinotalea sp. M2MS4P-6]
MADDAPRILGGRYEVGELIGRGGMAEVHIGHDTRLGRTVAIKILRSDLARDPSFQARFRREAQAAASLNHPAVVAVYDTGEDVSTEPGGAIAHVPFIVMEYVEGHTVRDILRDGSAVPIEEAVEITAGVLSALEYSHRAGIVHRDIKPANVMLTPTGAVKVMDFGIARAMADSAGTMTQTQAVIGTAQYLSPEQARGEAVDSRSDLYSTGCLLFELLTGRPPFIGDSPVAVAYQHAREEPQPPSSYATDVPETLDRITLKALAKDRDRRYRSAAEFRHDLEAVLHGGAISAPAIGALAAGAAVAGVAAAGAETQVMGPATAATQAMPPAAAWGPTGAAAATRTGAVPAAPPEDEPPRRTWLLWLLIAIAVLTIGGIIWALLANRPPAIEQVEIPSVEGMTQQEAVDAIEALDLVATPVPQASAEVESGNAIDTDPPAGEMVDPGTEVTIHVSSGAEPVTIEDLSSYTRDQAESWLRDNGFTTISFETENSPDVPADRVIKTDPAAGESVDPTTTEVVVYLSTGKVEVPDFRDQQTPVEDAQSTLEDLGLIVDVEQREDPDATAGTVIDQSAVGLVDQHSRVTLTEAIPPTVETTTVPSNLVGMTCTEAFSALGGVNLNGTCQLSDGTQAAGSYTVVSTNPAPGTEVDVGTTVQMVAEEPTPAPSDTATAGSGG